MTTQPTFEEVLTGHLISLFQAGRWGLDQPSRSQQADIVLRSPFRNNCRIELEPTVTTQVDCYQVLRSFIPDAAAEGALRQLFQRKQPVWTSFFSHCGTRVKLQETPVLQGRFKGLQLAPPCDPRRVRSVNISIQVCVADAYFIRKPLLLKPVYPIMLGAVMDDDRAAQLIADAFRQYHTLVPPPATIAAKVGQDKTIDGVPALNGVPNSNGKDGTSWRHRPSLFGP